MTIARNERTCRSCRQSFKCTNAQIKKHQGLYCSRSCRNVGRTQSPEVRFWNHVDKGTNCWLWTASTDEHGYGQFNVGGKPIKAHRFSYELKYGPLPEETPCALHRCDTRPCVRPEHLFPGTHATNSQDKVQKQRQCRGASRPLAKLNNEAIRDIRRSYKKAGTTQQRLADQYGVSQTLICRVLSKEIWKHI